jgi:tryptophan synthase alpha chain
VTAGYPDRATTGALLPALARAGAVGDRARRAVLRPARRRPALQEASQVALESGTHLGHVLELARGFPARFRWCVMTYANPVLAYGAARFARDAATPASTA